MFVVITIIVPGNGLESPAAPTRAAEEALPAITGDVATDTTIRLLAEGRGYVARPVASGPLVAVDGHLLDPAAASAWKRLRAAAAGAGHDLRLIAGYRDVATQRSLFLRRLSGTSAAAIELCLRWTAPPGYSKHHSGLAIDITTPGRRPGEFGSSSAYDWLAADGHRNARRFGFVPSYPPGTAAGPEPEPWEWVYLGVASPDRSQPA